VLSAPDPLNYAIDRLMRPANAAAGSPPAAAGAQPASAPQGTAGGTNPATTSQPDLAAAKLDRDQASRIFISALSTGTLAADDRAYLASRISAVAGVPQAEAEKRVDDAFAAMQQAKADAKKAADQARRAGAIAGFLTAAAALIAAAAAAAGAGLGGRHRDENGTLRVFGRERFW
jgi:hypothetical protein